MNLNVVIAPNPVLRSECRPVKEKDFKLVKKLSKSMFPLMYKKKGAGLAAPQIGYSLRFFIMAANANQHEYVIINPTIIQVGEPILGKEGCLSFPNRVADITRPEYVHLKYFDLDGNEREAVSEGFEARCILHEYDHLNGVTIF